VSCYLQHTASVGFGTRVHGGESEREREKERERKSGQKDLEGRRENGEEGVKRVQQIRRD